MFISADISTDMPACRFIGVITHLRGVRLRAGLAGRGSLAAPALTSSSRVGLRLHSALDRLLQCKPLAGGFYSEIRNAE